MRSTLCRFSFSQTHRGMMNAAVYLGVIDAVGLALLVHDHGADTAAILSNLDECAETYMHIDSTRRSAWIRIRDAVRFFETVDTTGPDKFGFKAAALAHAAQVLAHHHIHQP